MTNIQSQETASLDSRTSLDNLVSSPKVTIGSDAMLCEPMLTVMQATEWSYRALRRPDPRPLWLSMWYEGEVCCLFADSNLGKSIYAVEIARSIARNERVIYFDFELSDKQFQLRYTDDDGNIQVFPPSFLRAEINPDALTISGSELEERIIAEIEQAALRYDASKLIIDNLSFLCNASDKSDMAGRLMIRLIDLKKRLGLSILVLAHTPKRALTSPITQNDLAGSKKLINFFDSAFAIGKSARDNNLRYIKQIKVRAGAFEYDADNVIVAEIVKDGAWLHFQTKGFASERDHLTEQKGSESDDIARQVRVLREEGKTMSEIAADLGLSKAKVGRICKKENL